MNDVGRKRPGRGSGGRDSRVALGAGAGLVLGAALGNPAYGIVLGAAIGVALGVASTRGTDAMHRQMKAERERRAVILAAEGEARAVRAVYAAIHEGNPTNDLIAIKYPEALQAVADGRATRIFLPRESSAILGSIGGLGTLFGGGSDDRVLGRVAPETASA